MKFSYPDKDIKSLDRFTKSGGRNFGFYPVNVGNDWHGGIHIEGDKTIHAIADGEIIACRIPRQCSIEKAEETPRTDRHYSNGFVLIRHKYEYTAGDDSKKQFTFYSLYNHLLPYKKDNADEQIFGGKVIPGYLAKKEEGYEVTSATLNLRHSVEMCAEKKEWGKRDENSVAKGTFLKRAELNTAEAQAGHWTAVERAKSNGHNFVKVSHNGNDRFVARSLVKEITKITGYNESNFPFDRVLTNPIPIRSGELIGYTGQYETKKTDAGYKACHVEVFTINVGELGAFLLGNVKDEESKRRFFKFDRAVNLQRNYPVTIKGKWDVKLLQKGDTFSKIEFQRKKGEVYYQDLNDLNNNTYTIKESKFDTVNAIFDGILSRDSILRYVSVVVAGKGADAKRIASIGYAQKPNVFWIANEHIEADKKKDDIFELDNKFDKLYEAAPSTQPIIIAADTLINGSLQEIKLGNDTWFQLEYENQKGWLKDGTQGYRKISAYKWADWGFDVRLTRVVSTTFLFDSDRKNPFIKTLIEQIDTNGDGITADEMLEAFKKKDLARRLTGAICFHRTEWAGEATATPFLDDLDKSFQTHLSLQSASRQRFFREDPGFRNYFSKYLGNLRTRILTCGFWLDVPDLRNNLDVFYFHPIAFVEQMEKVAGKTYSIGDKGKAVLELNIRLAGFGGLLPTEEFTEQTEKGVKQFQRDYMKMANPTGIADMNTLNAIDEFSEKYRENVDNYKCPCNTCGGFGKGQFKGEYNRTPHVERNHKYEYPGVHQSLLWAVSAVRYYSKDGNHRVTGISSGYRCWTDNNNKRRTSTNHMGKAVDITFTGILAGKEPTNLPLLRNIRRDIFVRNLNTTEWVRQGFSTEPIGVNDGQTWSWMHLDVREFDISYREDKYFIKSNSGNNFSKNILDINN
jgi:hypothetical protein